MLSRTQETARRSGLSPEQAAIDREERENMYIEAIQRAMYHDLTQDERKVHKQVYNYLKLTAVIDAEDRELLEVSSKDKFTEHSDIRALYVEDPTTHLAMMNLLFYPIQPLWMEMNLIQISCGPGPRTSTVGCS